MEFWKNLNTKVNAVALQHEVILITFFKTCQAIRVTFFLSYYFASITASFMLLETMLSGITVMALISFCGAMALIFDCYWYCRSIDAFNDVNETIAHNVLVLTAGFPYTPLCHKEYRDICSTLRLIHLSARQGVQIRGAGTPVISTPAVTAMINMIYSALTFFRNFK
ncbi:uncharacterized protein LOC129754659 [Uranotaenia lowii]|uniref:uncharacterized protein LOC129754659 n=1 Tax=Uranotaenia lowii TaxID=190385 RepID=UPI0024796360|nr:uncharacterized protein LOC129754659 [Uranotaenia lowii]